MGKREVKIMKKRTTAVLGAIALAGVLNTAQFKILAIEDQTTFEKNGEVSASQIINIPDQKLKERINNFLGRYETPSQPITQDDLLQLTYLSLENAQVQDLTGLEYAKNLEELIIDNVSYEWGNTEDYNQIEDFSVISHLTNLKSLSLRGNQINDLSMLTGLEGLTDLDLTNNNITDIEGLEEFKNLIRLDLSNNKISNMKSIQFLYNLSQLSIANNDIKDINYLKPVFNLNSLDISNNPIEDIDVLANQQVIQSLDISGTIVKDFSVLNELTTLRNLKVNNVGLTSLDPIKTLTNLNDLSIEGNSLTTLEGIEIFQKLFSLSIGNNNIKNFSPLNQLPWLNSLSVNNSGITDLSVFEGLKPLSYLSLDNNHIQDITSIYSLTEDFSITGQTIELESIILKKGSELVLDNPLPGDYWRYEPFFEGEGIEVKNGMFNRETNKLTWKNVNTNCLEFIFGAYLGNDRSPSIFSGIVVIPVEFYSIPQAFDKLVENEAFTIVSGTGLAEAPLVLEIAQETKKEVVEELIDSYSDYELTVSKKVTRSGGYETYNLIFTKGEEKVYFELNVHSSDEEIINYLNEKITQPEGTQPEGTQPEGTQPEGTQPEGTQPEGTQPEGPTTGFTGLMGVMGLSLLSLGGVSSTRKKK